VCVFQSGLMTFLEVLPFSVHSAEITVIFIYLFLE